jgi:transcription elongation factor Elf1
MKIKEKIWQNRRDFEAIYVCEHCGHEEKRKGYDDANFHKNVIPFFKCKKCEKMAGNDYKPLGTKYPEGFQV